MMYRAAFLGPLTAAVLIVGACGTPTGSAPPASDERSATPAAATAPAASTVAPRASIVIKEFEFMPPSVTVTAGGTVTWTNEEDSLHTVTAGTPETRNGMFDSGEFDTGEIFEHTFVDAGSYPFFCDRHEFMRGEIVVLP